MTEDEVLQFIRDYYPENTKSDEELQKCIKIAFNEVCKSRYTKYYLTKAYALYALSECVEIDKRASCNLADARDTTSEKINDITVQYKSEKINGVYPKNVYHKEFLLLPKCGVKTSFNVDVSVTDDVTCGTYSATDLVYVRP